MTNNAQLDSQLSKMINEFNKQRDSGLICDTECQNNQNIRSWQHKVTERENTLANASQDLLTAQRQSILQNLDFYDTQMAFQNHMQTIKNYQQTRLNDVSNNVARNAGDTAVNQRLASFYSTQTGLVHRSIAYFRIIYWTLFVIQIIGAIMLFRKSEKNKMSIILGIVLLAIFPFYNTLYPLFEKLFHIFKLFPSP